MKLPDGWIEHPVMRSGQKVAFFMVNGNEIHCARHENFKGCWFPRHQFLDIAHGLINSFGCVITKVRSENSQGHRFVRRLGFYRLSDDGQNTHYRAERLNHARL